MAKYTKEEYAEAKKQKEALFKLILKKTGISYKELLDFVKQDFIKANLDVVTPTEKTQFDRLVF